MNLFCRFSDILRRAEIVEKAATLVITDPIPVSQASYTALVAVSGIKYGSVQILLGEHTVNRRFVRWMRLELQEV